MSTQLEELRQRLGDRTVAVGVAGPGCAGLPLAVELARAGFRLTGVDPDPDRVTGILGGESHVGDVPSSAVATIDSELVVEHAWLVFDTRNATSGARHGRAKVVRL